MNGDGDDGNNEHVVVVFVVVESINDCEAISADKSKPFLCVNYVWLCVYVRVLCELCLLSN